MIETSSSQRSHQRGGVMKEEEVLRILKRAEAVATDGHYVLVGGNHSSVYVDKEVVSTNTETTSKLCREMARPFIKRHIEVVVAPATAGIPFGHSVASHLLHLSQMHGIRSVYARESGKGLAFSSTYARMIMKKRVLLVDDVLTTGSTLRKLVEAIERLDAQVKIVGASVLCNRGQVTAEGIGVPEFHALLNLPLEMWTEAKCQLCAQGVPINTDLGHGEAYLARRRKPK